MSTDDSALSRLASKRLDRRKFLGLVATGAGAGLLAACGGSSTPPQAPATAAPAAASGGASAAPTSAPAAAAPTAVAQAAAAAVKRGGTLKIGQEADPITLDPYKSSNLTALEQFDLIYNSLARFDDNLKVVPDLAESWDISPDATVYTFKLRQGVKFHSGKDLTADDVVYSFEKVLDPNFGAAYRSLFTSISKVEAVDRGTVKFTLSAPFAPLLADMANRRGSVIVPKDFYEQHGGDLTTVADGTGPFKLAQFTPGTRLQLAKNPDYYGKLGNDQLPYLDGLDMPMIYDETARLAAIRAGSVDYVLLTSPDDAGLLKDNKDVTVFKTRSSSAKTFTLNTRRKPFDNPKVRQAIDLAVDRNEVIQTALAGAAELTGPVPTGNGDWWIDPKDLPYKVDVAQAKQLLAEAGFPNGFKTTYMATTVNSMDKVGVVLKQQLAKVNIDLNIETVEWGVYVARLNPNKQWDYDTTLVGLSFYADPDSYIYDLYYSDSPTRNYVGISDPQLDKDMTAARQESDQTKRKQMYLDLQKRVMDTHTYLYLYANFNFDTVRNWVQGYQPMVTGRRTQLEHTWLNK